MSNVTDKVVCSRGLQQETNKTAANAELKVQLGWSHLGYVIAFKWTLFRVGPERVDVPSPQRGR